MSFLKDLKKKEAKPVVIKQPIPPPIKNNLINTSEPLYPQPYIQTEHIIPKINPNIESIVDIPNINIMTSGILLGISLRDNKIKMLEKLHERIGDLLKL